MYESDKIVQCGCTVYSLNGFPNDSSGEYGKVELARLETQLKALRGRAYICSLNRYQMKAKAMLENYGFKCLARTISAHEALTPERLKDWKAHDRANGETIYLMGKGFYPNPKKGAKKNGD